MISAGRAIKILLIDSNVYFSKRLGDALRKEGFDVTSSPQADRASRIAPRRLPSPWTTRSVFFSIGQAILGSS